MGLNSIEESIQRVEHRVRLGGHKVAEPSISLYYEHGFKNLYKHFHEFDSVTLYDNAIADIAEPVIPREILYIVGSELHLEIMNYPEWVVPISGWIIIASPYFF
jgi:predicted ABC-type ATPase